MSRIADPQEKSPATSNQLLSKRRGRQRKRSEFVTAGGEDADTDEQEQLEIVFQFKEKLFQQIEMIVRHEHA